MFYKVYSLNRKHGVILLAIIFIIKEGKIINLFPNLVSPHSERYLTRRTL